MKPIIDISVLIKALTHPWNVWILLGVRRVRVRMAVQRREFILCEKSPLEKSRREKLRTAKWVSKKSKQSLPDLKNKSLLLTESSEVFRAEAGVVNCPTKYLCSSYISRCEVPGFFFRNDSRFQLPHGSRQWKKGSKKHNRLSGFVYLSAPHFSGDLLGSFGGQLLTGRGFSLWKSGCIPWVTSQANIFLYKLTLFLCGCISGWNFFPCHLWGIVRPLEINTNMRFEILAKNRDQKIAVEKSVQQTRQCFTRVETWRVCILPKLAVMIHRFQTRSEDHEKRGLGDGGELDGGGWFARETVTFPWKNNSITQKRSNETTHPFRCGKWYIIHLKKAFIGTFQQLMGLFRQNVWLGGLVTSRGVQRSWRPWHAPFHYKIPEVKTSVDSHLPTSKKRWKLKELKFVHHLVVSKIS